MNIAAHIRLMRPGDWVKNIFILPAIIFSERLNDPVAVGQTAAAFGAFCLISSGFYSINDAADAQDDRLHPVKCRRPVAAGQISVGNAYVQGVVLILAGLAAALAVNGSLAVTLGCYALLQVAYNLKLKRVLMVDVVTVAVGFGIRATAGAVAISVELSIWLLLCVFCLCLFLGFIKRMCDIASAEAAHADEWHSAGGYDDRVELNWLLGVSAVLAVVTYLMYALSGHAAQLFEARSRGFALLVPFVLIAMHRFYRRASRGLSDSPLRALLEDRAVLVSVGLFVAGVLVTLYVPAVGTFLEKLFVAGGEMAPSG